MRIRFAGTRHARLALVALCLTLAGTRVPALSIDELVSRSTSTPEAGSTTLRSVQSLRLTGKLVFGGGGFEMTYAEVLKRPGQARLEYSTQGLTGVQAWNGTEGWQIAPFQGRKDPERTSRDDNKGLIEDADLDGPLVDAAAKGSTLTYLGTEDVDGTDAHKIRVAKKDGDTLTVYLDPDYFLVIRIRYQQTVRGAETQFETDFGNYERVNGLAHPVLVRNRGARRTAEPEDRARQGGGQRRGRRRAVRVSGREGPGRTGGGVGKGVGSTRGQRERNGRGQRQAHSAGSMRPAPASQSPAALARRSRRPGSMPVSISGLGVRNIGSAAMSGRIAALAARAGDGRQGHDLRRRGERRRLEVARRRHDASSRSSTSSRCSRSARSPSIPRTRRTVWVGTGESWTRNSVSIGDGIYKSTDGGDTWTNVGSAASRSASRGSSSIPTDGETVYACVAGQALERLARSAASTRRPTAARPGRWSSKGANPSTGCASVVAGPDEPGSRSSPACGTSAARAGRSARAASRRRRAERQRALRVGATAARPGPRSTPRPRRACRPSPGAASRSRSRRPTPSASTRSSRRARSALYRSDDGGATWEERDRSQMMVWRPFYFAHLIVDPKNENRVFKPAADSIVVERRRQELQPGVRRRARRLARRLDRPGQHAAPRRRRRRRPLDLVRRRQPVVEGRQPADLAVLPRERGRQGPVPGLRRAAGQQLVGRATRPTRAASRTRAGRTCTAATASGCSPIRPIPTSSTPSRRAATSAASTGGRTRRATSSRRPARARSCASTGTRRSTCQPDEKGTIYIGAQFLFRSRDHGQTLGAHLARSDDQRSREAEAGAVGRRHGRQLRRRDAHDDLLDQRVAEERQRDLGRAPTTATCR